MSTIANEGRVLLLDDERLVRFTISAWLKTTGFQVVAVATPEEALDELRKSHFDVVLSDVIMGSMDGFMFRDAVRAFETNLPIIFLTSLVNDLGNQLMGRITEDMHSYYVPKNARREYLLGRLRQVVTAYRTESTARSLHSEMARNLQLASLIQRSLLPGWAAYHKYGFYSSFWKPHDVVSGDLCEYYSLTEHSSLFVIGDISGHGVPAALAMTAVQSFLKVLLSGGEDRARNPNLICQDIDRFIRNNLRDVAYMAGLVMYVNLKENIIRYCNAGSIEPLCFCRTDGSRIELNPAHLGCLPMGMMSGSQYLASDVVEATVPDDGVLCFYSDGFVDLTQDMAGEERVPTDMLYEILAELVRGANGTCDLGSLPYRLFAMLRDMGYKYAHDDLSFVVIGRTARHAGRFLSEVPMRREEQIDQVVQRVVAWAAEQGVPDETSAKLDLLLSEHLVNIRKHGLDDYGRRHEVVLLEIRLAGEGLEVATWDRGRSWTADVSEIAPHPDLTLDGRNREMATSGRGIAILRKISPRISYDVYEGLNRITFYVPYGVEGQGG